MTTHPRSDIPPGRLLGGIICESFRPGTDIDVPDLVITKVSRYDLAEPGPGQPSRWTLLEFEGPEEVAEELADQLSKVLLVEGGWYANHTTTTEAFVIFADKIFRYDRETFAGREEAEEYGRKMGVPEPQLDWGD